VPKFQNKKKPGAEIKISNLNNYSTVCCRNDKGTKVPILYPMPQVSTHTPDGTIWSH